MIRAAGRFENALIVLVADHGESFGEHDTLQHGNHLNQEELHVPLIVRFPQGQFAGVRVSQPVGLIDVFPTILRQTGTSPRLSYPIPGVDLTTHAAAPGSVPRRYIFAEHSIYDANTLDIVGVIDEDGYKRTVDMAVTPTSRATEKSIGLWDTRGDAGEQADLTATLPLRAAYDEQLIAQWLLIQQQSRDSLVSGRAPSLEMTDYLRKDLRALGYLH